MTLIQPNLKGREKEKFLRILIQNFVNIAF